MTGQMSGGAVILAFPARQPAAARQRLQGALDGLARALDEQRRAMRDWRTALDQLAAATTQLHGSFRRQECVLIGLSRRVAALDEQARQTVRWSDTLRAL